MQTFKTRESWKGWNERATVRQEAISFTISKVEMSKDIHFEMWKVFDIWIGQIQSELLNGVHKLQVYKLVSKA